MYLLQVLKFSSTPNVLHQSNGVFGEKGQERCSKHFSSRKNLAKTILVQIKSLQLLVTSNLCL